MTSIQTYLTQIRIIFCMHLHEVSANRKEGLLRKYKTCLLMGVVTVNKISHIRCCFALLFHSHCISILSFKSNQSVSKGECTLGKYKLRVFLIVMPTLGLIMLESPIVLLANSIEPVLFGLPFLIVWVLFWWAFCTIMFYIAYKTNWGKPKK